MTYQIQPYIAGGVLTFMLSALGCRHTYHYAYLHPHRDKYGVRQFHLHRFCFLYVAAFVACIATISLSVELSGSFGQYIAASARPAIVVLIVACVCAFIYALSMRRWHEILGTVTFLAIASGLLMYVEHSHDGSEQWLRTQNYAYGLAVVAAIGALVAFIADRVYAEYEWEYEYNQMNRKRVLSERSD